MADVKLFNINGTNVSVKDEVARQKIAEFEVYANRANSQYVKKDITSYFNDGSLYDRINARNGYTPYEGIFPGCYFNVGKTITAPGSDTTGTSQILVCGLKMFNPWNLFGSNIPHICCTAVTHFGKAQWNPTNTTEGGYKNSAILKNIIGDVTATASATGTISQQLYNVFGEHLKTMRVYITNAVTSNAPNKMGASSGASTGWEEKQLQASLFSEMEVYGGTVFSSSGFDTAEAKHQMPAFMFSEEDMMPSGIYFWLKDVASAAFACYADGNFGLASYSNASYTFFVRPRFVIS